MEQLPFSDFLQLGALGAFIYYTLNNNREWRNYLTERNGKLEKALDRLSDTLSKTHHDR